MRPTTPLLAILGASLIQPSTAAPQVMTAGELGQLCSGSDHVSVNVCRVYILGVAQGIALGLNLADGNARGARPCIPESVPAEQLEEALKQKLAQTLAANPAPTDLDAAAVLATVAAARYPCAKAAR